MNNRWWAVPVAAGIAATMLAGCAEPPGKDSGSSSSAGASAGSANANFKACMVSDSGGFDDKSFNQTSYKGLEDAVKQLGVAKGQVESKDQADFAKNIQSMVDAKCNIIVTVGFLLGDATAAAAKANPNINFAIVDSVPKDSEGLKNLKPLMFNTAQSSFLAGYTAASISQTGTVATFGGANIPTVTVFMDGFQQGVENFNKAKGKSVKVLGWDSKNPAGGQFVPEPKPFENVAGGKQTATNLKSQGADVIFPVAGPSGEGALQIAAESGGKISAIWVDTDGCVSAAKYCSSIVTSVYKGMDVAVFEAIKAAKEGKFSSAKFVGTLENSGTGLAPFHDYASKISAETQKELETLKGDIISGKLKIESASQPSK